MHVRADSAECAPLSSLTMEGHLDPGDTVAVSVTMTAMSNAVGGTIVFPLSREWRYETVCRLVERACARLTEPELVYIEPQVDDSDPVIVTISSSTSVCMCHNGTFIRGDGRNNPMLRQDIYIRLSRRDDSVAHLVDILERKTSVIESLESRITKDVTRLNRFRTALSGIIGMVLGLIGEKIFF
ncbi:hypothetical protein AB6D11_00130 [Vibrio splendidus]